MAGGDVPVEGPDRAGGSPVTPEAATRGIVAVVLTWLLPGLGHVYLGRRKRGLFLGGLLLGMFAVGLALEGILSKPAGGSYVSTLAAVADMGMGPVYFLAQSLGWDVGRMTAATHEVGNTFHWSAGVMNMLLMLDAHDVATGKK